MKKLLILLLLISQPGYSEDTDLAFTAATDRGDSLVFTGVTAEEENYADGDGSTDLSVRLRSAIARNDAQLTAPGVVSFFNKRLSQETLRSLQLEIDTHHDLVESEDYYLCVDNELTGYLTDSFEERIGLLRTATPVERVENTEEFQVVNEANGNTDVFWKIRYGDAGEQYWAKSAFIRSNGRTVNLITRYKDCSKIQNEILEHHLKIAEDEIEAKANSARVVLPGQSSGFMEYVCTVEQGSVLNAYDTPEEVESNQKSETAPNGIPRGMQVVRVQGAESESFEAERNGEAYIKVQVQINSEREDTDTIENQRYWVAERLVKQFEDCASIQTEVVNVCSRTPVEYYSNSLDLSEGQSSGSVEAFDLVYRRYGEAFSKRVLLNSRNEEVIYVPVSTGRNSEEILWMAESTFPRNCTINPEKPKRYRSSRGLNCTVMTNDNFPLEHASKVNYVTDHVAKFGARRDGGRRSHPATDLYSYYRHGAGSRNSLGGNVRAINRSVVKRVGSWRHTYYLVVKSLVTTRSWIYGEVGDLQVRDEQRLSRNQRMGKTAKYVRGGTGYPAMLHLERFANVGLKGRSHYGAGGSYEGERVDNPTCHVEYMSTRKFNKIWHGE